MKNVYANITKDVYLISDYNCLTNIVGCLGPCRSNITTCQSEISMSCPNPTLPTTTTPTPPTTTTEKYPNSTYTLYTFALSGNSTEKDFELLLTGIKNSVLQATKTNFSFAIVLNSETISPWMTSVDDLKEFTKNSSELFSATVIHDVLLFDKDDNHTIKRLNATMQRKQYSAPPKPEIILITDFVSHTFINAYEASSLFATTLVHYNFHIACTVKEVFSFYSTTILSTDASFLNYNDTNSMLPPIDGLPPNPSTTKPSNRKFIRKTN